MNIEDTTKDATMVDMTLAPQPKLDLSSIRANVDAIQAEALRLNDIIQGMPKQEATPVKSTPIDTSGKMQVPQLQQKTEQERMADFQSQRQMSFEAMGLTEEDFSKRQNLATQMSSLNAQLQQLDVAEQQAMLDIENLMPGALLSRVRGEQAQVIKTMSFKKAGIAAQMSALSGEYSAIQGRIDEAQNFFNQYIEYSTFEKKQEMDEYKWALDFYYDADQDTKKWLQVEYENKQNEYRQQYQEKQDEISNWFREQGLNIDMAQLGIQQQRLNLQQQQFEQELLDTGDRKLGILDVGRYREQYPEAGIDVGDTILSAEDKVYMSYILPEMIFKAKESGVSKQEMEMEWKMQNVVPPYSPEGMPIPQDIQSVIDKVYKEVGWFKKNFKPFGIQIFK
jgi:hypothetical protein